MMTSSSLLLLFLAAVSHYTAVSCRASLRRLSTLYMPEYYDGQKETFEFDADVAKRMAFDATNDYIYLVGVRLLHVLNFTDPVNPHRVAHYTIPYQGACTDVTTCGDRVAVSFDRTNSLNGSVFEFKTFDGSKLELVHEIDVGPNPTSLRYTGDCNKLLVAVKGSVTRNNEQVIDPEGGVDIITKAKNYLNYTTSEARFEKFNVKATEYVKKGVRWPWKGDMAGTTFSSNLEPSHVTMSANTNIAYVTLQKNNAIATLNTESGEFLELYSLGLKNWSLSSLDASDKDNAMNLTTWNISSLYQPSDVIRFHVNGVEYLASADTGADTVYTTNNVGFEWRDSKRGRELNHEELLGSTVSEEMLRNLSDVTKLGRLEFSTVDGLDSTGKISDLVCFGGRGISIYKASDLSRVYDSSNLLEALSAYTYPEVYNMNTSVKDGTHQHGLDGTSSSKGPEPVSVAYAEVELDGKSTRLLFVGIKHPGSIFIFEVPTNILKEGNRGRLYFESLQYSGGMGAAWEELWMSRISRDLDPEDIQVLPAERSPTKEPILAVVGSVSGTISLYSIYNKRRSGGSGDVLAKAGLYLFIAIVLMLLVALVTCVLAERLRKKRVKKREDPERKHMVQLTDVQLSEDV